MNLKTAENTSANPQKYVVPTKGCVSMNPRFCARVPDPFAENHAHNSQGVSVGRENQKAPLGWHRTRPDHPERMRFDMAETADTARDGFWLSQRRDGASDRWMVTWYDPTVRSFRYISTKTTDQKAAQRFLAHFIATTAIIPGARYDAPRVPSLVYFIGGDVGAIKIGVAVDPVKRLRSLQCGSPIPLEIFATIDGGAALEADYHRRFASARLHGEWFTRTPEIEAEISRLVEQSEAA